ncbi:MAG: hypothetical protein R3242_08990 [Akkermansiaceae bacterium]|nr:hypothetical protein [Akkermansiaceae bacterium]
MKRLLILPTAALGFTANAQECPNLVFILSDEQGWYQSKIESGVWEGK